MKAPSARRSDQTHVTSLVVWDVPSTVERGERFRITVGVKCALGCVPDRWAVEVRDHDGTPRGSAEVVDGPWPGTDGLFHAEVELAAPETEGVHEWLARAATEKAVDAASSDAANLSHAESSALFRVRVVPTPEVLVTVVATDRGSKDPLAGAKVAAHPYETVTNECGLAELRLPRGEYRLFVSAKDHAPLRVDGDATEDATISAELALDPELTDADIWT